MKIKNTYKYVKIQLEENFYIITKLYTNFVD